MKPNLIVILLILSVIGINAQHHLEVEGKAKIAVMEKDNTADSIVVRLPDGTLAIRELSTITTKGSYFYLDEDKDGFGNRYSPVWVPFGIIPPNSFVNNSADCNDIDSTINPVSTEICNDEIDQDCDDLIDCLDADCVTSPICGGLVDIMFLIDVTGDMGGAIAQIKNILSTIIIPTLTNSIPNLYLGLATFADFPVAPFGDLQDLPYDLETPLSDNFTLLQSITNSLEAIGGGDSLESGNEALFQIVSGEGISWPGGAISSSNVMFRDSSQRIVLVITSQQFHESTDYPFPTHGRVEAVDTLKNANISVLSINIGGDIPVRNNLSFFAIETNAVMPISTSGFCPTGINGSDVSPVDGVCPLVYDTDNQGNGLSSQVVDAIFSLLEIEVQ